MYNIKAAYTPQNLLPFFSFFFSSSCWAPKHNTSLEERCHPRLPVDLPGQTPPVPEKQRYNSKVQTKQLSLIQPYVVRLIKIARTKPLYERYDN